MKNQFSKQLSKISVMILAAMAFSASAQAATCAMNPDSLRDTQELAKKIAQDLHGKPSPADVGVTLGPDEKIELFDGKFHRVDRSKKPFQQIDAVGVVTGQPYQNQIQSYGTGTLISPCHMITNRHVVQSLTGTKPDASDAHAETLNKKVFFSVGQAKSCDENNDFQEQNIAGKVVDLGKDQYDGSDWAIVKLDRPVTAVKYASFSTRGFSIGDGLMRAGYPYDEVQDGYGMKNLRAQYVQVRSANVTNGIVQIKDQQSKPGLSGGGFFGADIDEGKVELDVLGIYVGGANFLTTIAIKNQMVENSRGTLQDIKRARETGTCN